MRSKWPWNRKPSCDFTMLNQGAAPAQVGAAHNTNASAQIIMGDFIFLRSNYM